jgi:ATP-dependent Clp endopeptidase proteolytic subunit ClpP
LSRNGTPVELDEQMRVAEIRKTNAEAAFAEAGVEDFNCDSAIKKAEAEKARWEAESARYESEMQRITRDKIVRQEDFDLLSDFYHHVYRFEGDVTQKTVNSCLCTLDAWHRQDPECDMEIRINSPGGSVIHGMSLVDQLTQYSLRGNGTHKLTITVRGFAASMAAIILQTADVRRMGSEAYLLVHEPSGVAEGSTGDIKDMARWFEVMSSRIARLFVARSEGKITLDAFQTMWQRRDVWLDSAESLSYGFIDEVG